MGETEHGDEHDRNMVGIARDVEEFVGRMLSTTGCCATCTVKHVTTLLIGHVFADLADADPDGHQKRIDYLAGIGADAEIYSECLKTGGLVSTGN